MNRSVVTSLTVITNYIYRKRRTCFLRIIDAPTWLLLNSMKPQQRDWYKLHLFIWHFCLRADRNVGKFTLISTDYSLEVGLYIVRLVHLGYRCIINHNSEYKFKWMIYTIFTVCVNRTVLIDISKAWAVSNRCICSVILVSTH